jgi:hypothetical protein
VVSLLELGDLQFWPRFERGNDGWHESLVRWCYDQKKQDRLGVSLPDGPTKNTTESDESGPFMREVLRVTPYQRHPRLQGLQLRRGRDANSRRLFCHTRTLGARAWLIVKVLRVTGVSVPSPSR